MITEIYALAYTDENGERKLWTNRDGTQVHTATSRPAMRQLLMRNAPAIPELRNDTTLIRFIRADAERKEDKQCQC